MTALFNLDFIEEIQREREHNEAIARGHIQMMTEKDKKFIDTFGFDAYRFHCYTSKEAKETNIVTKKCIDIFEATIRKIKYGIFQNDKNITSDDCARFAYYIALPITQTFERSFAYSSDDAIYLSFVDTRVRDCEDTVMAWRKKPIQSDFLDTPYLLKFAGEESAEECFMSIYIIIRKFLNKTSNFQKLI